MRVFLVNVHYKKEFPLNTFQARKLVAENDSLCRARALTQIPHSFHKYPQFDNSNRVFTSNYKTVSEKIFPKNTPVPTCAPAKTLDSTVEIVFVQKLWNRGLI